MIQQQFGELIGMAPGPAFVNAHLRQARNAGDGDDSGASDRGDQECHTEWNGPLEAEENDADRSAILQNENNQQDQ